MRSIALICSLFILWVLALPTSSDSLRDQIVRFEAHQVSLNDIALPEAIGTDFEPGLSANFITSFVPFLKKFSTALGQHEHRSGPSAHPRLHIILRVLRN